MPWLGDKIFLVVISEACVRRSQVNMMMSSGSAYIDSLQFFLHL